MKVALTGVTGHVGAAVLRELHARSYEIRVLLRGEDRRCLADIPVEIVKGDVLHPESLTQFVQHCDALIHCAAVISVNGDPGGIVHRTNVEGTKNVMESAKQCGVRRIIHLSSIHAYQQFPVDEVLDEKRGLVDERGSAYDRSKRTGQDIALSMNQQGMEVLVISPTAIVGPFDFKPSRAGGMLIDLLTGRLSFVIEGGFDFCDCRDVANAIVNGLTQGSPGECYVLSGKWYSLREIVSMLSDSSQNRIPVRTVTPFLAKAGLPFVKFQGWIAGKEPLYTREALEAILTGNRYTSSAKARQELNYHSRPLDETIRDTFHWFRESGYLDTD